MPLPSSKRVTGLSYTIPDSYWSDINLRCFPVLSAITTFYILSFCLIILYYHNFKCQIHLEAVKCDVARMRIRCRVTGATVSQLLTGSTVVLNKGVGLKYNNL